MTPSQRKAARLAGRGGRDGTLTLGRPYPMRSTGARPIPNQNPEPWRPIRIGDIVDEALRRILREGAES